MAIDKHKKDVADMKFYLMLEMNFLDYLTAEMLKDYDMMTGVYKPPP